MRSIVIMGLILVSLNAYAQDIRYVDASAGNGGDGLSWSSAFDHLHSALSAAEADGSIDQIWVAGGTYSSGGTPFQMLNDVLIYGGFAGHETGLELRDPTANATILDGSAGGICVVDFSANAGARLDGFTITSAGQARGLSATQSSATLANCLVTDNLSVPSGAGVFIGGGSPTFVGCRFENNQTNDRGGAVYLAQASGLFVNCVFSGNSGFNGGAFGTDSGNSEFVNCLWYGNTATFGGAAYAFIGTITFHNNTIADNSAATGGGGLFSLSGAISVTNSIVYGNTANNFPQIRGTAIVEYSCVEGGYAGVGNISSPPQFISASTANYQLLRTSGCIDSGNSALAPPDVLDLDEDGDVSERIPLDLAGVSRFFDVGGVPDVGVADPPNYPAVIDMGAFEDQDDCNGNGISDAIDIASGTSQDCNGNGLPDECELENNDCNADGIPDDCQLDDNDCNGNGIPDDCDIAGGTSQDCNGNGLPDECELAGNDCNFNGVPDDCDIAIGNSADCQADGVPDECQLRDGNEPFYAYDDGFAEFNIGLSPDVHVAWLTRFQVQPGSETLGGVSIAFGTVAPGRPVKLYIWSDPDGDGVPGDAVVLAKADTLTANPNTSTFNDVEFPPTYIGPPGTSFFVGAITRLPIGEPGLAQDKTSSAGQGWIIAHESVPENDVPIDPNDLSVPVAGKLYGRIDDFGHPGNWMIRALTPAANDCNLNGVLDACDCPADLDGDGQVNLNDLLEVLINFGEEGYTSGDVNCDRNVDIADLLIALTTFGDICD